MRVRLPSFKPPLLAAALLTAAGGGVELALRLSADGVGPRAADLVVEGGLTERSRTVHHRLCPLRTAAIADPDSGTPVEVSINSHGLRGPEVTVPKPPGVFRILCLGDETVLAPTLPEPQTLPARLQDLLQARTRLRVEVLNAGVPGDCPLLAALRLRHSLLSLQPDLIVLHFDMSDVADDQRYRRYTRIDGGAVPYACAHPAFEQSALPRPWWADLQLTACLARWLNRSNRPDPAVAPNADVDDPTAATAWLRDSPPDWSDYVEQSLEPVAEVRRLADGTYAQLVVATCPQPWQVAAQASDGPGVREAAGVPAGVVYSGRGPFQAVERFTASRGIACCDASPAFLNDQEPRRLYQTNTPNLSALGQELYARALSDFLAARLPAFGASEHEAAPATGEPQFGPLEIGDEGGDFYYR